MTKADALQIIDAQNKRLIDPVEMLHFVWLRVIILKIPDDEWNKYVEAATEVLRQ